MYYLVNAKDVVRVLPNKIEENLENSVQIELENTQIGRIVEGKNGKGTIIAVKEIEEIGEGRIIHGDEAVYFDVKFTAIMSIPKIQEVVEGEIKNIKSFGAFVDMGPFDGFCHISQVFDDYVSFDEINRMLNGKDTGIYLKEGDKVMARIVSISAKSTVTDTKIGLTMRQPFLGKPEWSNVKKVEKKETKTDDIEPSVMHKRRKRPKK